MRQGLIKVKEREVMDHMKEKKRIHLLLVWLVRSFLVTALWVKQCGVLLCRKAQSLQPGNDKNDISDTLPSNSVSDAFCWYTFVPLGPVVHKSDNAIQRIRVTKTYCAVRRLEIYPVDSVNHSLNNGESGWITRGVLPKSLNCFCLDLPLINQ